RVSIDTSAKRETRILLRVVFHKAVQVWMHHPRTHDFNPARSFANPTAGLITKDARHIHLSARFNEGKETRPQPCLRLLAEELFVKTLKSSFQISERNPLVYEQSFDLMEHRRMCRIQRITPKHATRTNDSHRRLHLFHCSNLNWRSVGAQE